ncbi:MAG TPA: ATP-binding protein [Candidatus Limnocylindrales bacterium]|nr:ATP-binding protein [Candidatus Limnocylindrales bacterium]
MRAGLALHLSPFAIAAAIAGGSVLVAVAVVGLLSVSPPPPFEPSSYLDRAWYQALSGAVLIPLAWRLRRRNDAVAFALFAAACLLAGWAMEAIRYDDEASGSPVFLVRLVAGLALVPATTAAIGAFASTPPRRLARAVPVLLVAIVAISVVTVVAQTAVRVDGGSYDGIAQSFVDWFSSPFITLTVLGLALMGSVRNEALRFVSAAAATRRSGTVPRRLGYAVMAALTVAGVVAVGGLQTPGAAQGHTLLPLLAVLIAIIGARWSAYVSWTAVSISLAISSGVIFSTAVDVEVQKLVQDPDGTWIPTASWVFIAGVLLVVTASGLAAASMALVEASRSRGRGDTASVPWSTLTAAGIGVAAWASVGQLVGDDDLLPLLEGPLWAFYMATVVLGLLLVLAAFEAMRNRLVPAIAEAEATARRPLRPFMYLETVAIETLAARAALRRSTAAAERSRLASDLHAQILPSLADIRTRYETGAADVEVADRLRQLEREVRDLMAERRLVVLEEFGIVEAIEWLIGRAEERASMDIQLSVDDRTTETRPPREVERAAFRIAQLAIENALQHAAPSRLELAVLARSDEVRISVADDGRGFGPATASRDRDRVGISDMRSQAADVHGEVQVVSPASGGTMVTFAWPAA